MEGVGLALSQIASKGKISAEEINQLAERVPQIRQAMIAAFGSADTQVLQRANITATAFVEGVTKELEKLPQVTGGINNAFENLADAGTISLSKLGASINKNLDIEGLANRLSGALLSIADGFASLTPYTQKFAIGLGIAAAAVGPLVYGIGSLLTALPAIEAGLAVLGTTATAALGPIGIGVAAVAAAAYLIINNWDDLVAYFSSGEGSTLFSNLADAAKSAADAVGEAFSTIAANSQNTLGGMASSEGALSQIFKILTVDATSAANIFAGTVHGITSLLTGEFSQAFAGAKQAAFGLIDPLAALFGFTVRQEAANPFLVLSKSATEFNAVIPELAANLKLLNGARLDELAATINGAAAQVGLLEALRAKLKALKEQRETETTVGAITVDNGQIKALEDQIKKLEGVDAASKKATDAIKKLREELGRLTALDGLLGDTPSEVQVLERRIATLTTGLKTLIDAGISPTSKAFRGFVSEAVNLQQSLDKLQSSPALDLKPVNVKSLIPATIGDTLPQDVARLLGDYAQRPYVLPVPIRLEPIANGLTDFQQNIGSELLKIGQGFREAQGATLLFGNGFDEAGAKASVLRGSLEALLASGVSPLTPAIQQLAGQYRALAAESLTTTAATQVVKGGIMDLASGISSAFSDALTGTQTLGDALLKTLLNTVGHLATELGGILLASGLGIEALKVSLKTFSGVGAIAAGIGLLAIGGIASAAASNLGKSAGSGSIASAPKTNYGSAATSGTTPTIKVIAEFRLRGQDLVAVGRTNDYRVQRTN